VASPEPEPPEGVAVVWPDGRRIKIPVVYVGSDGETNLWEMPLTTYLMRELMFGEAHLSVAVLPPHTGLTVAAGWLDHGQ
jgi:hypothetical protein